MLIHSIHACLRQPRLPAMSRRKIGDFGTPFSLARRVTDRRPVRAETGARQAAEPAICIEEAIRRFVEEQPAQLYRGGA